MWLRAWRCLLVLGLTCLASMGWAADHIVARAYFEDAGGVLTQTQVQSQAWTPYTGVLSRGYSAQALWLRLQIDPLAGVSPEGHAPALGDDKLILRIRPSVLDEVALFDPLQPSEQPRRTGDRYAWSDSEYPSRRRPRAWPGVFATPTRKWASSWSQPETSG